MTEVRECPLCGENMRLTERATASRVPGSTETTVRRSWEWVCPECDYFEEAESQTGEA